MLTSKGCELLRNGKINKIQCHLPAYLPSGITDNESVRALSKVVLLNDSGTVSENRYYAGSGCFLVCLSPFVFWIGVIMQKKINKNYIKHLIAPLDLVKA